jgi:hypothetical protein
VSLYSPHRRALPGGGFFRCACFRAHSGTHPLLIGHPPLGDGEIRQGFRVRTIVVKMLSMDSPQLDS